MLKAQYEEPLCKITFTDFSMGIELETDNDINKFNEFMKTRCNHFLEQIPSFIPKFYMIEDPSIRKVSFAMDVDSIVTGYSGNFLEEIQKIDNDSIDNFNIGKILQLSFDFFISFCFCMIDIVIDVYHIDIDKIYFKLPNQYSYISKYTRTIRNRYSGGDFDYSYDGTLSPCIRIQTSAINYNDWDRYEIKIPFRTPDNYIYRNHDLAVISKIIEYNKNKKESLHNSEFYSMISEFHLEQSIDCNMLYLVIPKYKYSITTDLKYYDYTSFIISYLDAVFHNCKGEVISSDEIKSNLFI